MSRRHELREAVSGRDGRPAGPLRHALRGFATAHDLQRTVGNNLTASLLALGQAKLVVNPASDSYEREADTVAAQVVARLRSPGPAQEPLDGDEAAAFGRDGPPLGALGPLLSRRALATRDAIGPEGGELSTAVEQRVNAARRQGTPLPDGVRRSMEGAFGADFSGVRVHTGPEAETLNRSVGAVAFTVGGDIFLGRSAPGLSSSSGEKLLAHELTHTLQQGAAKPRAEGEVL